MNWHKNLLAIAALCVMLLCGGCSLGTQSKAKQVWVQSYTVDGYEITTYWDNTPLGSKLVVSRNGREVLHKTANYFNVMLVDEDITGNGKKNAVIMADYGGAPFMSAHFIYEVHGNEFKEIYRYGGMSGMQIKDVAGDDRPELILDTIFVRFNDTIEHIMAPRALIYDDHLGGYRLAMEPFKQPAPTMDELHRIADEFGRNFDKFGYVHDYFYDEIGILLSGGNVEYIPLLLDLMLPENSPEARKVRGTVAVMVAEFWFDQGTNMP